MKTEVKDLSETRKSLLVEIPTAIVDTEIDRVAKDYSRAARIPGFRPGKVPAKLVRQRFRDRILHDVAHDLIPRAVDEALRERGLEPIETPDIRDVTVEEGQPLRFTATFDTLPPLDPIPYDELVVRRPRADVEPAEIEQALERLRINAAKFEPVEDRPVEQGDTVVLDLDRRQLSKDADAAGAAGSDAEHHTDVSVEIGSAANPPGFDEQLIGLAIGATKTFEIPYPEDYPISELAGTHVEYKITLNGIRRRDVPELDDEFAKDLGQFDSLQQLRERVTADLQEEANRKAEREMRDDLLGQLARRVTFDVPESLVERETDRRAEEFVRRLIEQGVDPRRAPVDWDQFRERQKEPAAEAVRSALVLDEVARQERLQPSEEDLDREIQRHAERTGRTAAAVRARLEKEGGITRLYAGLRREKAIDFLLSHAKIVTA